MLLRHQPEVIGLQMDAKGWVSLDQLLQQLNKHGHSSQLEDIQRVVANNNKQRFALDMEGRRIRANQGHSLTVDVELTPTPPPPFLYHGTAKRFLESIRQTGIQKMNRQYVHLSADQDTAMEVGLRHGPPIVLTIDCQQMLEDGYVFYLSENKVWLVDQVPIKYVQRI
ncbi:MAG: RNA 2'-phosphotransferase [Bacteroidota bacterium]